MHNTQQIQQRFKHLEPHFDERLRRLWAAAEADALGFGGAVAVERCSGVSRRAIAAGKADLRQQPEKQSPEQRVQRIRREGGGRKKSTAKDPRLHKVLMELVEPATCGDPENPLRWTSKSVRHLAQELNSRGIAASHQLVAELLTQENYSLQANVKTRDGGDHPQRNAQFEHINARIIENQAEGQPVISVDTKKKELVGDFKNSGREWRPKGQPESVRVHDFVIPELGKANPYGIYDLSHNQGWVNVGTDHDTAAFAVASIERWWEGMGKALYSGAERLMITADGGGSNGSRNRLWKRELQRLANKIGLTIEICHLPPGTSKWNKIEHRLFSFISQNWRGKPLVSHEVIVQLIAATTNKKGLKVHAQLDSTLYPTGTKVTDEEMAELNLELNPFQGQWNYTIHPKSPPKIAPFIS